MLTVFIIGVIVFGGLYLYDYIRKRQLQSNNYNSSYSNYANANSVTNISLREF